MNAPRSISRQIAGFVRKMATVFRRMFRYAVLLWTFAYALFLLAGVPHLAAATLGLCLDCGMVAFSAANQDDA
jgi:hypothetical protein